MVQGQELDGERREALFVQQNTGRKSPSRSATNTQQTMPHDPKPPRLYSELADWWTLLSPASHYVEEAEDLLADLQRANVSTGTLLELGCGGGSLACNLKSHYRLTLTDVSEQMLSVCRRVNPECEHVQGDMRSLDLGRQFDVVLIHDAIMYAITPEDVQAALQTAARHCKTGGVTLIVPDCVRETFRPETSSGGEDGPNGRGLRYLEWSWDPDPTDHTFEVAYAFLLRDANGDIRTAGDRHRCGLFKQDQWIRWMTEAGFDVRFRTDPWNRVVFTGIRTT